MVRMPLAQVKMSEWNLDPEHVKDVKDGMFGVVNEGGTGIRAALPHVEVCGKTGSAQLASNEFVKGASAGKNLKDNAWFVGFAPRDNPEIVVVALWEHGEHGQFAAAIVRDVIKAYFDKKQRLTELQSGQNRLQAEFGLGMPTHSAPAPAAPALRPEPVIVTGAILSTSVAATPDH
jgi:penicillin-binding protein 2